MLSGRFWFSTIQSMRLSRRPRRQSFFATTASLFSPTTAAATRHLPAADPGVYPSAGMGTPARLRCAATSE
jgi:hypothetical protein